MYEPLLPISQKTSDTKTPKRIQDLLWANSQGQQLTCYPDLQIVPAEFFSERGWQKAHIFLCRFTGTINERPFAFRKCYTRGPYESLCKNGMNAVWVANRYLKNDYRRLNKAGIDISEALFSLQDIMDLGCIDNNTKCPPMTIYDFIYIAKEGNQVLVEVSLDKMLALEHHPDEVADQTYLIADFTMIALTKISHCQRCLASYPTKNEETDKTSMNRVANKRLQSIFYAFKRAGIYYNEIFFHSL